jgi:hypothetical protein
MGFSGGGSNVLKSHTHDGTIVQDGGSLNMDNVTQGALTAGDIVYSDGSHLQRLAIGAVNTTLSSTGVVPQWAGASGAAVGVVGHDRLAVAGADLNVTFPAISGSDIASLTCYWTGLATAGSPYGAVEITINGLTGNLYKTEWQHQRAGAQTLTSSTDTKITPNGATPTARLQSGWMTIICDTAQQAAVTDTVIQYFGSISGAAPNFGSWSFIGTYDDPGGANYDNFTQVNIEMVPANWQIGSQLTVLRNNVS